MIAQLALLLLTEDVFVSGRMDANVAYNTFRIPALCQTRRGTLLAFAEGRNSVDDQSANVIVLRRRPQSSKVWSPLRVVMADRPNAINNPCVLATRQGQIILMVQRYPKGFNERTTSKGFTGERACRSYVLTSDDDGLTWSAPRELTSVFASPDYRSLASGPGVGIELTRGPHKGRLLFPFNTGTDGTYDVFAAYSDDKGKTWRRGALAPKAAGTQPNETQIVELADGTILMNARNQASLRQRLVLRSRDGGETWDPATPDPTLPDPVCQGSIVRLSFRPDVLAFTNPADPRSRQNGTLRLSTDGGKTWPKAHVVTPGSFAYSCLCPLPNGRLGVLYEAVETLDGGHEGYRIRYAEIDARALLKRPS